MTFIQLTDAGIATASPIAAATVADFGLHEQVITALLGDRDYLFALQNLADAYEGVFSQIRTAIYSAQAVKNAETSRNFLRQEHEYYEEENGPFGHVNKD
ncbi:hypothetical protein GcM1_225074 [Golovinomyces cichoracearum]|uniref:Uncharacterized protein n=1 Tax=Golovinomyces cichoracearum TaxID=62708 RepID=A0A420IQC6_9PEZI|nr:hypothetical protein GcM1_225074 [Golovinomyces cichoracearum]